MSCSQGNIDIENIKWYQDGKFWGLGGIQILLTDLTQCSPENTLGMHWKNYGFICQMTSLSRFCRLFLLEQDLFHIFPHLLFVVNCSIIHCVLCM